MALSMLLLTACGGDSQSDTQQETESFVSMMGAVTSTEIAEVSPAEGIIYQWFAQH